MTAAEADATFEREGVQRSPGDSTYIGVAPDPYPSDAVAKGLELYEAHRKPRSHAEWEGRLTPRGSRRNLAAARLRS
jgi:hypothetical protein